MSSALTDAGTPLSSYPPLVLATAQVVLGAWLGSTFRPGIFREAGREMAVSVAGTLLLLALSCASAAGIAGWLGLDWETAVLAVAPGGVTEMSLAARFLAQHGNPFQALVADSDGRAGIEFGLYGVPETYLLDGRGTVRWRWAGPVTPDTMSAELEPLLRKYA